MLDDRGDDRNLYRQLFSQMVSACAVARLVRGPDGQPIDFVTLDLNPAFERLLGVGHADVVGRLASTFIPPEELPSWLGIFGKVADTGACLRYEQYSIAHDRWFSGTAFLLSNGLLVTSFDEVTEKRRIEEAIRQSEELYRLAVEAARLAAVTFDFSTGTAKISRELAEILGLPEGTVIGAAADGMYAGIFEEDRPRLLALMAQSNSIEVERREVEFRVRRPAGDIRWIRILGRVHSTMDGGERRPTRFTGVVRDFTDERAAAQAAAASEAGLRAFFEQSAAGVAVVDVSTHRIVRANRAYGAIVGRPHESLVGSSTLDLTHPDDREAAGRLVAGAHDGDGRDRSVQRRYVRPDGSVVWTDVAVSPLSRPDSAEQVVLEVIIDISERKAAEDALDQSRLALQAVWDHAPTMMCSVDRTLQVTLVNKAFARHFAIADRRPSLPVGVALRCAEALRDPTSCGRNDNCATCVVHQALMQALETGVGCGDRLLRRTTVNGDRTEERDLVIAVAPIDTPEGRKLLLCLDDVTEKERAVEELKQSREQLRALAGRLQAVREAERSSVAREIHDVLAQDLTRLKIDLVRLKHSIERLELDELSGLVARVAEMCQLADGTIGTVQHIATELRPPVLDSLGLCAAIDWYARDFASRNGLACKIDVPDRLQRLPEQTATALYRVLQESLTNVARHAAATRVSVTLTADGPAVRLTICDNGRGIPSDVLKSPRSIGLVGMRERAALLGGTLDIRSTVGRGTCVDVAVEALS